MAKTYDPGKVNIILGGIPISGYADGTFVSVAPAGDRVTKSVGADGETSRAISRDYTHEVTITLQQTSASNDFLSSLFNEDRLLGTGQRTLQITDKSGTTLMFWGSAWIKTEPTMEDGKEVGERAWVLDTGQVSELKIGGNI